MLAHLGPRDRGPDAPATVFGGNLAHPFNALDINDHVRLDHLRAQLDKEVCAPRQHMRAILTGQQAYGIFQPSRCLVSHMDFSFPLRCPFRALPDSGTLRHDYPASGRETQTPRRHPQVYARHEGIGTAKPVKRHITAFRTRQKRLNPMSISSGYSDKAEFDE